MTTCSPRLLRIGLPLLMLALLGMPAASAEDAESLLTKARNHEFTAGNHAAALRTYRTLLEQKDLPDPIRLQALMGAARCHKARAEMREAERYWLEVQSDDRFTEKQKAKAEQELAAFQAQRDNERQAMDERAEEIERARRESDRQEATRLLDEAEKALDADRVSRAIAFIEQANELGGNIRRINALYRRAVEQRQPESGALIRDLTRFVESGDLDALHELLLQAEELYKIGGAEYRHGNHAKAHDALLKGIDLIDESGFLLSADVGRVNELATLRAKLKYLAEFNRDKAQRKGVTLERPIPEPPAGGQGRTLKSRLFVLLAEAFGGSEDSEQPLKQYVFLSPGAARSNRSLATDQLRGRLSASRAPGGLTRARWAERFVRTQIPAAWTKERILVRSGDVLYVKHTPSVHRQIAAIRDAFEREIRNTQVDVHVFTTTAIGLVKACEALQARAPHQSLGHDVVLPGRLVSECKEYLLGLEGRPVTLLGSARLDLSGTSSVELMITDLTERHPTVAAATRPELSATADAHARFGLWLDLYAEAMPLLASKEDQHAVSCVARVREPVGSTLVPKQNGTEPFTRIPRMLEQRVEADHVVPTVGTLMLAGLRNPFPGTEEVGDQLLILIGARGVKEPDPPRTAPSAIVPADIRRVVLPLGPLATEVLDYVAPEAWPRRHAASAPVSLEIARQARARHLQDLIARGAQLIGPDEPWENAPIDVSGDDVVGSVDPEELAKLTAFLRTLREHEDVVYEIDVRSVVVTRERFAEWIQRAGVRADEQNENQFVLDANATQVIDPLMRAAAGEASLFALDRTINARATQRVGARKLTVETIVRDQQIRTGNGGEGTYTAVPGVAEQGLIVEVRPRLERTPGYRAISVRARAARLQDIERVPFPHPQAEGATIDMPRWYPLVEASGAPTLSDDQSVLLRLPMPGAPTRLIVVKIAARKVR
ncbi:MAG: hypothetical protein QNJ98_12385 [Planctomycetota bacterium]|nr:hypothetical protein [Planctomycetota bacterium]